MQNIIFILTGVLGLLWGMIPGGEAKAEESGVAEVVNAQISADEQRRAKAFKELFENQKESTPRADNREDTNMQWEDIPTAGAQDAVSADSKFQEEKRPAAEVVVPPPIRSGAIRKREARRERHEAKQKEEDDRLNNRPVIEEVNAPPELRGKARTRRQVRVLRSEKVQEQNEQKEQKAAASSKAGVSGSSAGQY